MKKRNVYYNPERFGLEIVGEVRYFKRSTPYNGLTVVWRDVITREHFWGDYFNPKHLVMFDNYQLDNLTQVASIRELLDHLKIMVDKDSDRSYHDLTEDIARLMEGVS